MVGYMEYNYLYKDIGKSVRVTVYDAVGYCMCCILV